MYEEGNLNKKLIIAGGIILALLIFFIILLFNSGDKPITKEYSTAYITVGDTYKVNVKHIKKNLNKLKFLSSDDSVVTINKKAVVKGKKEGKATIIIRDDKYDYVTQDIVVNAKNDEEKIVIKLSTESVEIKKGETLDIKKYIENIDEITDTLFYSVSDEKVVKATEEGILNALEVGKAEVTIKTENSKDYMITINVIENNANNSNMENKKPSTTNKNSGGNENSGGSKPSAKVYPSSLNVSPSSKVLYTNYGTKTFVITSTVGPSNASNKTVRYSSSNTNIATVSSGGIVTAKNNGDAIISVSTSNGIIKKVNVAVKTITNSLTSIIANTSVLKATGKTSTPKQVTLATSFVPTNTSFNVLKWTSSDTSIATVASASSTTATLSLNRPGEVRITATNSNNPLTRYTYKDLTVRGLTINAWKSGSDSVNATRSSISMKYKANDNLNLRVAMYPAGKTLDRSKFSISSSNTKVLKCPANGNFCTMVGKGTATLSFTYNPDTSYTSYVKVTLK